MTNWAQQLKAQGLRATPAAQAVLAELQRTNSSLSHDELTSRLTAKLGANTPDRVTIYRVLERLVSSGLVASLATTSRARRFCLHRPSALAQFECNRCHRITALSPDAQLQSALEIIQQRLHSMGMTALHPAIATQGVCADCTEPA
ncbi:transcriptional repressor [Salinispirillum sp. LH 10-3-1]|uniref:Transcriptional repressor n=1 Tax=Salinispirillum sp. LH 10-3-1 TaxID=2952525 RepID=A0AB38YG24_9GAMM